MCWLACHNFPTCERIAKGLSCPDRGKMKKEKNAVKIGVCGIHAKAGATHISHMLALYLAGSRRKKTVVVEGDGKASFRHLEEYLFGKAGTGSFRMRRCTYCCGAADGENLAADYMIYDAGSGIQCRHDLLSSCDLCIAVGDGGVFCRREWEDFFRSKEVRERVCLRGMQDWRFVKNHAKSGVEETLALQVDGKKQKIRVYGLGTEENLLHLSKEAQKLMQKMDI